MIGLPVEIQYLLLKAETRLSVKSIWLEFTWRVSKDAGSPTPRRVCCSSPTASAFTLDVGACAGLVFRGEGL